jgi:tyrosine-protein kinase Etk/Wzc
MDIFLLYRKMIAWIVGIVGGIGIAYALLSAPVYQANLLLQVEQSNASTAGRSPFGDIASMFEIRSSAENETQVVASRSVLAGVVDTLQLDIEASPVRFPIVGEALSRLFTRDAGIPGMGEFNGYNWGKAVIVVKRFDLPAAYQGARYTVVNLGGSRYKLSGRGINGNEVASVGAPHVFQTEDGPLTLEIAALGGQTGGQFSLIRRPRIFAIDALQNAINVTRQGRDTSDMLRVQLRGHDPRLVADTLNSLARHYLSQNAAQKENDAAHSLAVLESEVPEMRRNLETAEAAFTALRSKLGSVDIEDEARTLVAQSATIDGQITQLKQNRSEQASRYSANYPSVVALDQQVRMLESKREQLTQRMNDLPSAQRELVAAERNLRVRKDLYLTQLSNIANLNLLRAGRDGTVRVIDMAAVPDRPLTSRRIMIAAIACALGLFLASLAAFLRDVLFAGISYGADVETKTGLKVAAVVPRAMAPRRTLLRTRRSARGATGLLAVRQPDDPAVENLRSLRAFVNFSMQSEGAGNLVMFTSPSPLLGKSFVSSNFAAVLAAGGKRVLLIDADLRRASLSRSLEHDKRGGLSEVLAGVMKPDAVIVGTEQAELYFMPAGSGTRNAADLLSGATLGETLQYLATQFDVVVLDTAPLTSVPDALMLAPFASGNIYLLARAGVTKPEELKECERRLAQVGERFTGVVLNCVDPRAGRFRLGVRYDSYRYVADATSGGRGAPNAPGEADYVKT